MSKDEEQEASDQRRAADGRRTATSMMPSCLYVTHQLGSRMVYKIATRSEGCVKQAEREGATQTRERSANQTSMRKEHRQKAIARIFVAKTVVGGDGCNETTDRA
jgi:hypothetical protein